MAETEQPCYLEVDVNGDETFIVDKEILCKYSSKFYELFRRVNVTTCPTKKLKVNFNDFPGGANSFEVLTRFSYNKAMLTLTPFNICLLHSAASYMEMDKPVATGVENLVPQTEKFLKNIDYWSWNELMATLKQCQKLLKFEMSSSIVQKCVESLVRRVASGTEASSSVSSSSSESYCNRFSCDTKSTELSKKCLYRATWWFDDLAFFSLELLEIAVRVMISKKLDNAVISKFLFFYHRSNFSTADSERKSTFITSVIDMLYMLDWNMISFKSLFGLLRITSNVKVEKSCSTKLESMIGCRLDEATLDTLLIPPPNGMKLMYNVDLVLRLVKALVCKGCNHMSLISLQNVAKLMDMYMTEVAPDLSLKPKMLALATALPDFSRESHDGVYSAIDLYIQVHIGMSKEDKLKICGAVNYEKLSNESCVHLTQNKKFPSKPAVDDIVTQHLKLKSALKNLNLEEYSQISTSGITRNTKDKSTNKMRTDNDNASNHMLKDDIYRMQWKVVELEKQYTDMQSQMLKIKRSQSQSHTGMKSLPKFCSYLPV